MEANDIQRLMEFAQKSFQPDKAKGLDAVIQFYITGDQPSSYYATIRNQELNVEAGEGPNPRLTLSANTEDILKVFSGQLNPMQAYMQGKVDVKGDMGLAMRLASVFKAPPGMK